MDWWNDLVSFIPPDILDAIYMSIQMGLFILVLFACVAYVTLAERKVIGFMQVRIGPNRVGPERFWTTYSRCVEANV